MFQPFQNLRNELMERMIQNPKTFNREVFMVANGMLATAPETITKSSLYEYRQILKNYLAIYQTPGEKVGVLMVDNLCKELLEEVGRS